MGQATGGTRAGPPSQVWPGVHVGRHGYDFGLHDAAYVDHRFLLLFMWMDAVGQPLEQGKMWPRPFAVQRSWAENPYPLFIHMVIRACALGGG